MCTRILPTLPVLLAFSCFSCKVLQWKSRNKLILKLGLKKESKFIFSPT